MTLRPSSCCRATLAPLAQPLLQPSPASASSGMACPLQPLSWRTLSWERAMMSTLNCTRVRPGGLLAALPGCSARRAASRAAAKGDTPPSEALLLLLLLLAASPASPSAACAGLWERATSMSSATMVGGRSGRSLSNRDSTLACWMRGSKGGKGVAAPAATAAAPTAPCAPASPPFLFFTENSKDRGTAGANSARACACCAAASRLPPVSSAKARSQPPRLRAYLRTVSSLSWSWLTAALTAVAAVPSATATSSR